MMKTREERKNEMVVEQPIIGSSFNNSSIKMNGGTDHVKSDFTLNRGSPFGSTYKEASFVEELLLPVPHGLLHGLVGNEEGIFLGL